MNVISIDCEYNQPSHKCIEIAGAVYDSKSGMLIEKFQTYVNPYEPIQPFITELTQIRDQDVVNAPSIKEAYFMLKEFHKKHQCFRNPIVWGSGVRNDSQMIHQESGVEEDNFMGYRVIDAKSIYQSIQMHNNKEIAGGLEKTCKKLKIGFEGRAHGALADAVNTFRVWFHLVSRFT